MHWNEIFTTSAKWGGFHASFEGGGSGLSKITRQPSTENSQLLKTILTHCAAEGHCQISFSILPTIWMLLLKKALQTQEGTHAFLLWVRVVNDLGLGYIGQGVGHASILTVCRFSIA